MPCTTIYPCYSANNSVAGVDFMFVDSETVCFRVSDDIISIKVSLFRRRRGRRHRRVRALCRSVR